MLHCWMATCCNWLASCCRRSAVRQMARLGITSSGTRRALWHSCTAWTCCLKLSMSANRRCNNGESSHCKKLVAGFIVQSKHQRCFLLNYRPYYRLCQRGVVTCLWASCSLRLWRANSGEVSVAWTCSRATCKALTSYSRASILWGHVKHQSIIQFIYHCKVWDACIYEGKFYF